GRLRLAQTQVCYGGCSKMAKTRVRHAPLKTHCLKGHSLVNAIVFRRKSGERKGKLERRCRICDNAHSRQWYQNNAERTLLYQRCRKYGVTHDDYMEMLAKQNGVCAICNLPERSAKTAALSVDHDHSTGKVRGLLCVRCNAMIGM